MIMSEPEMPWRLPGAKPPALLGFTLTVGVAIAVMVAADSRRAAALVLGILVVALIAIPAIWLPWRGLPAPREDQRAVLAELPSQQVARNRAAVRERRRARVSWVGAQLLLAAVLVTPLGATVLRWAADLAGGHVVVQMTVAALVVAAAHALLGMGIWLGTHEKFPGGRPDKTDTGALAQAIRQYIAAAQARLQQLMRYHRRIGLRLAVILTAAALAPRWWWLWLAGAVAVREVFRRFKVGGPFAVYQLAPLEDGTLRKRLLALMRRTGVSAAVYRNRDSQRGKAIGSQSGFGGTWIAISDNYGSAGATDPEVETVVAHELAHVKFKDSLWRVLVEAAMAAAFPCALNLLVTPGTIFEPATVGLLLVALAARPLWTIPYGAIVNRRKEAAADWWALNVTGDPDAFTGMQRRIFECNQLDPAPSRMAQALMGGHPTIVQRMAMARAYRRLSNPVASSGADLVSVLDQAVPVHPEPRQGGR